MAITYPEVEDYYQTLKPHMLGLLRALEEQLVLGRDEQGVPFYVTKFRLKSINSAYLKTKRKAKDSLDDITDFGGLRVLCMFQQDIPATHKHLVDVLQTSGYELIEFKVFNWHDKKFVNGLKDEIDARFGEEYVHEVVDKETGYKSAHYVVRRQGGETSYCLEIQLRTLLQDVWAELEHALAYKQGSIHPHIKKSFNLLARDLETNDILLAHLRDIRDKEHCTTLFSRGNAGPYRVFTYEEEMKAELLTTNDRFRELHEEYENHVMNREAEEDEWVEYGKNLYQEIRGKFTVAEADDPKIKYWIDMENAFWLFWEKRHDEALDVYEQIIGSNINYYVPFFRKGEIHFIKGEIEKALVSFDRSEELLKRYDVPDFINTYRLKVKLANVYWLLGDEYCDLCLEEILEAEKVLKEKPEVFSDWDRCSLTNNLCWYELERFLKNNTQADFESVCARFEALEALLDTKDAVSNWLDTAAWFCYQRYLYTSEQDFLERAKQYCTRGWNLKNRATHVVTSVNVQRNHTQEIMSTAQGL